MPVMDGYEATKCIRELEKQKGINEKEGAFILAVSGNYSKSSDSEVPGTNGYITKPCNEKDIREYLKKFAALSSIPTPKSPSNKAEKPSIPEVKRAEDENENKFPESVQNQVKKLENSEIVDDCEKDVRKTQEKYHNFVFHVFVFICGALFTYFLMFLPKKLF